MCLATYRRTSTMLSVCAKGISYATVNEQGWSRCTADISVLWWKQFECMDVVIKCEYCNTDSRVYRFLKFKYIRYILHVPDLRYVDVYLNLCAARKILATKQNLRADGHPIAKCASLSHSAGSIEFFHCVLLCYVHIIIYTLRNTSRMQKSNTTEAQIPSVISTRSTLPYHSIFQPAQW